LRPSKMNERICKCGKPLKPYKVGTYTFWQSKCGVCRDKQAAAHEKEEREKNRLREEHKLREALSQTIPRRYEKASLGDLPTGLREMLEKLMPEKGAYIYGETGRGKTHALCAVARELITRGYWVKRVVWERLAFDIRSSFNSSDTDEGGIVQPLLDCDVLIIEDVGTSTSNDRIESDFNLRTLLMILDYRNEFMRPTWFSSNKSVAQLGGTFDDRTASRIREHCEIILLEGKDKRG